MKAHLADASSARQERPTSVDRATSLQTPRIVSHSVDSQQEIEQPQVSLISRNNPSSDRAGVGSYSLVSSEFDSDLDSPPGFQLCQIELNQTQIELFQENGGCAETATECCCFGQRYVQPSRAT